ncbi:helix-turn-helix domain-containing protein [Amycolatopsis sp. NPDC003865]
MAEPADIDYTQRLGAEIRHHRMSRGMSLRALAKELTLSGHGTLVDYELGRRIPPANLVAGCERIFGISDGSLRNLREKALAERADLATEELLRAPEAPVAAPPVRPRWPRRRVVVVASVVVLLAGIAFTIGFFPTTAPVAPASAPVRFGFEDGTQRWSPFWGGKLIRYDVTTATAYEGGQSLQITTTGFSNVTDKAIGTTHGLATLRPGMLVSCFLRVPLPERASVRFFAYDSKSQATWAPETPKGGEAQLPQDTAWKRYDWTVPQVDVVQGIGIEIYQFTDDPVILWLDAISW